MRPIGVLVDPAIATGQSDDRTDQDVKMFAKESAEAGKKPGQNQGSERRSRRSEPRGAQLKSNSPFFTPAMKSRHSEIE